MPIEYLDEIEETLQPEQTPVEQQEQIHEKDIRSSIEFIDDELSFDDSSLDADNEPSVFEKAFNIPAAANRAAIQKNPSLALAGPFAGAIALSGNAGDELKSAAVEGIMDPDKVPTFQELAIRAGQELGGASTSVPVNFIKGLVPSALGLAADIATNPADVMIGLVVNPAAGAVSKTRVGKDLIKFLNRKRSIGFGGEKDLLKASKLADNAAKAQRDVFTNPETGKFSKALDKIEQVGSKKIAAFLDEYSLNYPEGINVTKFNKISNRIKEAGNVSGKEIKNLQNEISKSINWKVGRRDPQNAQRIRIWGKIQDELSELNPELKSLNKEYGELAGIWDDLYSVILERGRPGSARLKEKVGRTLLGSDKFSLRQKQAIDFVDGNTTKDLQFRFLLDKARNTERLKKAAVGGAILAGGGSAVQGLQNVITGGQ
jgi:hypothetical protein